ncbi:MAG: serine protein kinase PrkA, partial [Nanoarchaeota archaeon]|nr:serine protein kinase PrkA [Nanoarchaeota archaeon]
MKLINKNPMEKLNEQLKKDQHRVPITFDDYLDHIAKEPQIILRNTFQLFSDFIHHYIPKGVDEYSDDPESIKFVYYDCNDLLVEGTDNPFFADRLFANKLVTLADSLKRGAQQNKKYLFIGPHGSGKSTFLNNLFRKLEGYTRIPEGLTYETIWKIDKKKLGWKPKELEDILKEGYSAEPSKKGKQKNDVNNSYLEIPCPSHDYPFLIIPKEYRREFFDELIKDEDFKEKLFNDKEYDWVFKKQPCTICSSIYTALSEKLNSPD